MKFRDWHLRVYGFNVYNRSKWVEKQAACIPAKVRVLDVGAGTGPYRRLFAHCEYRAHDFGQESDTIGKYTILDYESDIADIPVPDNFFDVVLCTEVLEHVPEPIKALCELARILKPGGRMLLTAPLGSWLHQEPYHFYGGYTPYWYRRFLNEAGCKVESIDANEGFFSFLGQEVQRFSNYLDPRHTWQLGLVQRSLLSLIWLVTLPLKHIFPLIGYWLDRFGIEKIATVGYHVVAIKKECV